MGIIGCWGTNCCWRVGYVTVFDCRLVYCCMAGIGIVVTLVGGGDVGPGVWPSTTDTRGRQALDCGVIGLKGFVGVFIVSKQASCFEDDVEDG